MTSKKNSIMFIWDISRSYGTLFLLPTVEMTWGKGFGLELEFLFLNLQAYIAWSRKRGIKK